MELWGHSPCPQGENTPKLRCAPCGNHLQCTLRAMAQVGLFMSLQHPFPNLCDSGNGLVLGEGSITMLTLHRLKEEAQRGYATCTKSHRSGRGRTGLGSLSDTGAKALHSPNNPAFLDHRK